jgi:hypothetical protein
MGPGPIAFILDCYSVHRSQHSKDVAAELGIDLYFVPPGATDLLQPLDRTVYAVLKAAAKKLFHDRCMKHARLRRTKRDAVEDLIAAWERMPDYVIEEAWGIYYEGA